MNIEVKIARARSEILVNYIDIDISGFGSTSRNPNNSRDKSFSGNANDTITRNVNILTQQYKGDQLYSETSGLKGGLQQQECQNSRDASNSIVARKIRYARKYQ